MSIESDTPNLHGRHTREGSRLVTVDIEILKAAIREVLAEMPAGTMPAFYSQRCLPPGMSHRAFLDAIRCGDLPARCKGKVRFVARADYEAYIARTTQVQVCRDRQPIPANDVRAALQAARGK